MLTAGTWIILCLCIISLISFIVLAFSSDRSLFYNKFKFEVTKRYQNNDSKCSEREKNKAVIKIKKYICERCIFRSLCV